jgi:hypothetical protein
MAPLIILCDRHSGIRVGGMRPQAVASGSLLASE